MVNEVTSRLLQLKKDITESYPDFEKNITKAWSEVLEELAEVTSKISQDGPSYLPSVQYSELRSLSAENLSEIKRKGSVIIRNVVDRKEVEDWKADLQEFVKVNPDAEGVPADNKQFFQIFYTKPQIMARSHINVLDASTWLNKLYSGSNETENVDLNTPLTYVDRFRMRQPGIQWGAHPPHMDGGSIERWEDTTFRTCFENIFKGDWKQHDPYMLNGRLGARTSAMGLPNQASIFRTFQGWLALSQTAPQEGTLKVFPDVLLSTAYIILRPFFTCTVAADDPAVLEVKNWKFDISTPDFPGVSSDASAGKPGAARPFEFSPATHPHLQLDNAMTSVPTVNPGDMVFWQCDVIHSVEKEHSGKGDSSVMYIPAVPRCKQNLEYIKKQAQSFLSGMPPPDFPQNRNEHEYKLCATVNDLSPLGRMTMGLESEA